MTTKYRNIGGGHALNDATKDKDATIIKPGTVFSCDDPDLCKKFPNKFEKVHPGETTNGTDGDDGASTPSDTVIADGEGITADAKKEVTADFPSAGDNDLQVFQDKTGWWIYADDEAVHDKPLKKKNVDEAIEKYLED